jgi:hypothetical protein
MYWGERDGFIQQACFIYCFCFITCSCPV